MIAVCGPEDLLKELESYKDQIRVISRAEIAENKDPLLLYLYNDGPATSFNAHQPVILNLVAHTLATHHLPDNIFRFNGWKTFISRSSWEIAGKIPAHLAEILERINKKIIPVPDEPGFIAGRVLAMIINEAWFAKEDGISTEKEIDTAMKLGTGYPFGPFEWTNMIGAKNIVELLHELSKTDARYQPCELLKEAAIS